MSADLLLPFGATPSPRQLAWHALEYYGFIHFTVNTFTGREWGLGNEPPAIFNPTDFSADQIAETAALGGMKGLILTAKHHDGFCLWPSDYTAHSVKNSPWKDGNGDVVDELAVACEKRGLKFGVYLSPWDRNHPDYARSEYLIYYRNQLRELLTRYGPLFEIWFDGANGGDGYYGGKYEKRSIDGMTYYQWEETFALVRELQPDACIFNPPGADIRWVGNERGIAGDPCWHTYDFDLDETPVKLNHGVIHGPLWFPAEADVSIRPGWFYHRREDQLVRTPRNLFNLFLQSVGRGASLNLNLPPTRAGRIHNRDRNVLYRFNQMLEKTFGSTTDEGKCSLMSGARITASNTRGGGPSFNPTNLLDGSLHTLWACDEDVKQAEITLDFERPVRFNLIELREAIALGQRVEGYAVDVWRGENWREVLTGTMIGYRRLALIPDQSTSRLRLRITQSAACPGLTRLGVYHANLNQNASPLD